MHINYRLDRTLGLLQYMDNCEADCPEECLELTDLIGKLSVRISKGELPERWRQAVPWEAAGLKCKARLAVLDGDHAAHIERVMGTSALVGWSQAGELADLLGVTKVEAAHAIHAATLDRLEREG